MKPVYFPEQITVLADSPSWQIPSRFFVAVEAFEMTRERRATNVDWPEWMHLAWNLERGVLGSLYPTEEGTADGTLSICTLEGSQLVSWNDWIIRGVGGEIYPCKHLESIGVDGETMNLKS